MFLFWTSTNH